MRVCVRACVCASTYVRYCYRVLSSVYNTPGDGGGLVKPKLVSVNTTRVNPNASAHTRTARVTARRGSRTPPTPPVPGSLFFYYPPSSRGVTRTHTRYLSLNAPVGGQETAVRYNSPRLACRAHDIYVYTDRGSLSALGTRNFPGPAGRYAGSFSHRPLAFLQRANAFGPDSG